MRVRISTKGDVNFHIRKIFDLISSDNFIGATAEVESLRGDVAKHFITRNINMTEITDLINGFQHSLRVGNGNNITKKEVLQDELSAIIIFLNGVERKNTGNKYERLMEIYEDLIDDVQNFNEKERPEDAEAIKVEFREIRSLESEFMGDTAEYTAYKDVVRQMGLCIGALTNIVNGRLSSAALGKLLKNFEFLYPKIKLLKNFEFLYPKIEVLVASKLHEKDGKIAEVEVAEDQIEQIKFLSDEGNNAEQISDLTGLDMSVVEQYVFGDIDGNE
jgi:hypothetical protein